MHFFPELYRRNAVLCLTGWLHVGLLVVAVAALAADPRLVTGLNPWIKPLKFCLSIVVYTWSMGWLLAYLPAGTGAAQRIISGGVALTMVVEIGCIFGQAARGVPSHFNVDSPLDGAIFALMGTGILLNTVLNGWALGLVWGHRLAVAPAVAWGIRLGLLLFIAGSAVGGLMVSRLAHTVGAADGGPGLIGINWSSRHGDLRIAHFVGMHALQGLPVLGWLLGRRSPWSLAPGVGIGVVATLAAGWALFTGFVLVQALQGHPFYAAGL